MNVTVVTCPQTWNAALCALPLAHVLQTWEWGQFKARHTWRPRYLLWQDDAGRPRAAALVLSRRLGRLPLSVMYVPKGPALDYGDPATLQTVLDDLEALARRERVILIKIDPDVRVEAQAGCWAPGARGWVASPEQVQFRNTMTIDLTQDEDTLLAAMHQKTRYNIRLAARKGVTVRAGSMADLDVLYAMYDETARRDGFIIRPAPYYRDAWGSFIQAGLGYPLIAQVEGLPVAGLVLFQFATAAFYMYGMSRDVHRDKMPNYLLQWAAMRWARGRGCTLYDLWGAPDSPDESDSMYGVYRFKLGLGARFVRHVGAWDYAPWRPLYWLYTVAMPGVIACLHRRHRAGTLQAN